MAYRDIRWFRGQLLAEFPKRSLGPEKHYTELQQSKGLFKPMLLTHPPVKELLLVTGFGNFVTVGLEQGIVTVEGLIEASIGSKQWKKAGYVSCRLHVGLTEGQRFALLARTVDEITGYEMLEILDSKLEALPEGLLLKWKQ